VDEAPSCNIRAVYLETGFAVASIADHTSEVPILLSRVNSPLEFLSKCLGEKLFYRDVELLGEDDGQTGVNVVLIQVSSHSQ